MSKNTKVSKINTDSESDLSNIDSDECNSDSSFEEIFEINGSFDDNDITVEKKYNLPLKTKSKLKSIKIIPNKILKKKENINNKKEDNRPDLILKNIIIKKDKLNMNYKSSNLKIDSCHNTLKLI